MTRPHIPIEETFNSFVLDFGGELVSDIVGKAPDFYNADYLFRSEGVIAELKCLEKDLFKDLGYQKKVDSLFNRWVRDGIIEPFPRRRVNSQDLPDRCQKELLQLVRHPVSGAITKANKQIKETKKRLALPDATGLLLLANDGNYSLEPDAILHIVTDLIRINYSCVNHVVLFTANMPAELQTVKGDIHLWAMAHGEKEGEIDYGFMNRLGDGWIEYVNRVTGVQHKTLDAAKEISPHIRYKIGQW